MIPSHVNTLCRKQEWPENVLTTAQLQLGLDMKACKRVTHLLGFMLPLLHMVTHIDPGKCARVSSYANREDSGGK